MVDGLDKRPNIQSRIARPFLVVMIPLVVLAPILGIARNQYAGYVMPAVIVLFAVMMGAVLLYNKIWLRTWLPYRKSDS